jgi:hemerythrin-like metal-binding protein
MVEVEFKWDSSLALDIPHIDEEHRQIIDTMNRIADLNRKSFDKEQLLSSFKLLIGLTQKHFKDEEELMRQENYPNFETHKRIHDSFLETLERYKVEMESSVYRRFPSAVFDFFKTWITTHIMIVDRQYQEFFIKNQ